jgi:hypothetical protein
MVMAAGGLIALCQYLKVMSLMSLLDLMLPQRNERAKTFESVWLG